jgi:hypothetical protein
MKPLSQYFFLIRTPTHQFDDEAGVWLHDDQSALEHANDFIKELKGDGQRDDCGSWVMIVHDSGSRTVFAVPFGAAWRDVRVSTWNCATKKQLSSFQSLGSSIYVELTCAKRYLARLGARGALHRAFSWIEPRPHALGGDNPARSKTHRGPLVAWYEFAVLKPDGQVNVIGTTNLTNDDEARRYGRLVVRELTQREGNYDPQSELIIRNDAGEVVHEIPFSLLGLNSA